MSYWIKHITNKLIYYNQVADKYETSKLVSLMLLILLAMIFINQPNYTFLFSGIGVLILVCSWAIFRVLVNQGEIKTDFSIYDIPKEGETITFISDKTFDSFSRPVSQASITSSAVYIKLKVNIQKGDEYKVIKTLWRIDDFVLQIVNVNDPSDDCAISFLETRSCWKTKRDIRNNKINQILK